MKNLNAYLSKRLNQKIKGSTLVEVLMAILVCLIVFSLAQSILLKMEKDYNTRLKLKADMYYNPTQYQNELIPGTETFQTNGLKIKRSVSAYDELDNINIESVLITSKDGKPLSIKQRLIPQNTNANTP